MLEGESRSTRRGVGIVVSRANVDVANRLLESALAELDRAGVGRDQITVMAVPGGVRAAARRDGAREDPPLRLHRRPRLRDPRRDRHFDYVVAARRPPGCSSPALETGVPVAFGVLTVDTPSRRRRARAPRPSGTRSRWPISSSSSAPPPQAAEIAFRYHAAPMSKSLRSLWEEARFR